MTVPLFVIPGLTRDLGWHAKIPGQARDDKAELPGMTEESYPN